MKPSPDPSAASTPAVLQAVFLEGLNAAAGACLALDAEGQQKLAPLHGAVFCLEITAPAVTLYLCPSACGMEFRADSATAPAVTLTGSALAFAQLSRPGGGRAYAKISISGDAELGRELQQILMQLDIDWEEGVARILGDATARQAGNVARGLAGWAARAAELTRVNATDFLTEEKRLVVGDAAMTRFAGAVHHTRADVDRLTLRVARLQKIMGRENTKTRAVDEAREIQPPPSPHNPPPD